MPHAAPGSAHNRSIGLAFACLGALGFSFKAIFIKAAYAYGVDAETLLALRMGYALPCFVLMGVFVARRDPMRLTRRDWRLLCVLGALGYYAASYLDFLGLQFITAALERLILFLYPTMVLLLSAVVLKKPIARGMLPALLVGYVGIALAVGHDLAVGGRQVLLGSVLVFASALSYALYLMLSGEVVKRLGSTRVTAYATSVACVLSLGQFMALRPLAALAQPWPVHALGMAMALFSTVLPIWLVAESIRRLGAGTASLIGTLGPVFTIVLAVWLLGESLGALQVLGGVLVILGVSMVARVKA